MSDLATLAARMYPPANAEATPAPEAPPQSDLAARMYPAKSEDPEAAPEPAPVSVDELVQREPTAGEAFYTQHGGSETPPETYNAMLAERFDGLEYRARHDGNEADSQALSEGRREAAALMHELQVTKPEAQELTRTLGNWMHKPALDEDANWDNKLTTLGALEKEWGRDTQARIRLAQRTAAEACKRMPWLADLLESGAGNDIKLIKHFAEIGLRKARKASKVGGNRNG